MAYSSVPSEPGAAAFLPNGLSDKYVDSGGKGDAR